MPIYKAIKLRLASLGVPVFFYIGQYTPGKDNTSYVVPVIYIEMPDENQLDFFGKKLMVAKNANVKIHYLSHAPFKNHDNAVQDAALELHETKVREIDVLLNGWNATNGNGKNLTEQLIPSGGRLMKFQRKSAITVVNYRTDLYSNHLNG